MMVIFQAVHGVWTRIESLLLPRVCGVELGHRRGFPARGSYVTGRIDKQATALASTWLSTIIRIDQRRPSTYKDGLEMHQNTITIKVHCSSIFLGVLY